MSVKNSSNNSEILEKVLYFVGRQFEKDVKSDDLEKKLEYFSSEYLDKIEIVMRLEDEFSVQISDDEVDGIVYVDDFVKIIGAKRSDVAG